jgi:hypothetical protein
MADYDQILAVKRAAQGRLLVLPGVHAVGIGPKRVNGKPTGEPAIIVFVEKKKPASELPPNELVPAEIDGVKTDVIEEELPHIIDDTSSYRPLEGGIQVIARGALGGTGTVGCIGHTLEPQPKYVALTCQHVVGMSTRAVAANLSAAVATPAVTFSAVDGTKPLAGALVVLTVPLTTLATSKTQNLEIFWLTKAADTPATIAAGVAAEIVGLGNAGVTASSAGPTVTIAPTAGFAIGVSCDVYRVANPDQDSDLQASVAGGVITLTGKASEDNYGVYTNFNLGGASPSYGVFTPVAKGDSLNSIATAVGAALNALITATAIANVTVSVAGAQITITGVEEVECGINSDTRVGQPTDTICSECCKCCNDRIGKVIQARLDLDVALVQLDGGLQYLAQIQDIGLTGVVSGTHDVTDAEANSGTYSVSKRGRTTLLTSGTITALHRDGTIGISGPIVPPATQPSWRVFHRHYAEAISILSSNASKFSDGGDSGSAVVNINDEVVGILFGGGTTTGLATAIGPVLSAFNLSIDVATIPDVVHTVPGEPVALEPARAMSATPLNSATAVPPPTRVVNLEYLRIREKEITDTPMGQLYASVVRQHLSEAVALVNKNRRVAVAWQRNSGPDILQAVLRVLQRRDEVLPKEINGRPLLECVANIQKALARYASPAFAKDLSQYTPQIVSLSGLSYVQLLAALQSPCGVANG